MSKGKQDMIQTSHKIRLADGVTIMKDSMTINDINKCGGNPHNCYKVKYQILASRSDTQKNNNIGITRSKY